MKERVRMKEKEGDKKEEKWDEKEIKTEQEREEEWGRKKRKICDTS